MKDLDPNIRLLCPRNVTGDEVDHGDYGSLKPLEEVTSNSKQKSKLTKMCAKCEEDIFLPTCCPPKVSREIFDHVQKGQKCPLAIQNLALEDVFEVYNLYFVIFKHIVKDLAEMIEDHPVFQSETEKEKHVHHNNFLMFCEMRSLLFPRPR